MKKTLIAFAALSAIAGMAQAQSTVTIYGIVDAHIASVKTNVAAAAATTIQNPTQSKIDSGGLNGSRWGIRVSEDLGAGLAAIGNLESGFDISTGVSQQGGALFGRRANVGLTSASFGTVTLGRNSSSYDDVSADHTMMGASMFDPTNNNVGPSPTAASTILGSAANASVFLGNHANIAIVPQFTWVGFNTRFNNSVKYISPNFSGFSGSAMYAFGEDKTTAQNASKTVSANLKYANGPLLVSGGYQSEGAAVNQTTGAKPALENTLLSVAYDFGVAKVGAGFNRAKFKDVIIPAGLPGANGSSTFAAQREYSLSVSVPLGATTLSAAYGHSKGDTLGKSDGFGVQAVYSLSKRTSLYAGAASTKAFSNVVSAANTAFPGSNIGKTTTYATGIRHTF